MTLRGSVRWGLVALGVVYAGLAAAEGGDDPGLYVFPAAVGPLSVRALVVRAVLGPNELRYVGFLQDRRIALADIARVDVFNGGRSYAPVLTLCNGKRIILSALSSGPSRAEEHAGLIRAHLLNHPATVEQT